MPKKSINEQVQKIIIDQLEVNPEQVTATAKFREDLGADILDKVELLRAYEETFTIEIPMEESEKFVTVGDSVEYLEKRLNP